MLLTVGGDCGDFLAGQTAWVTTIASFRSDPGNAAVLEAMDLRPMVVSAYLHGGLCLLAAGAALIGPTLFAALAILTALSNAVGLAMWTRRWWRTIQMAGEAHAESA